MRLALLVLGLYPLAFRHRYGQEMRALLEATPTRPTAVLDLLRGAVVAHARPPAALSAQVGAGDRVRASASGVLACWVAFAAAGFGFYKTTEDASFTQAGSAHPLLGDARAAIVAAALVGSAAVVLGALPLILAALAHARRQPRLRLLVSLPVLAVLLFVGLTRVLVIVAHSISSHRPTTVGGVAFIAWGVAGLACGAVCVVASRKALFAVPASRGRLIGAFASGTLVTAAMAAMTVATALYAIALPIDASHLAGAPNGPFQATSVTASLVGGVVVMVMATALAATATRRGWRAAGELGSAPASAPL
ncbi:MAG: hypothetical protein M3071_01265 [Actinomycetota bacterium]|nr:hypothetical protein [Actinomycetota bacterium]